MRRLNSSKPALRLANRNPLELTKILGVKCRDELDVATRAVAKSVAPKPKTALEFQRSREAAFLATSLLPLDAALRGGLPIATVTEIAGPPGSGKTQFSLMLAMQAALPRECGGLDGAVIYIDTEAAFSGERLVEMLNARNPENPDLLELISSRIHLNKLSISHRIVNPLRRLPYLSSSPCRLLSLRETVIETAAKLVVVDSIAAPVRRQKQNATRNRRLEVLTRQAAALKDIAETFQIPVIVTNQITSTFRSTAATDDIDEESGVGGGSVTAALGPVWPHFPTTRLLVQYSDERVRQIIVAKSPAAPCVAFDCTIESRGIVARSDVAVAVDLRSPVEQQHRRFALKSHCDVGSFLSRSD
ncbi:DNA repair protein RAD51 homolog 2-like [Oscarella lobularis]|uniref:DNA repair protein RAD51 homolog 2-like n=1 Tax=Oscarella lobularis TaxID=121494 RepID=UPI003313AFC6